MPAVNSSTVPTAVEMMLLRVHWFVADHESCTVVGEDCTTSAALGAAGCGIINLLATETRKQRSSASYASMLGCMRCAPVCEVDCDGRMACSVGVPVRLLKKFACGNFFGLWRLSDNSLNVVLFSPWRPARPERQGWVQCRREFGDAPPRQLSVSLTLSCSSAGIGSWHEILQTLCLVGLQSKVD